MWSSEVEKMSSTVVVKGVGGLNWLAEVQGGQLSFPLQCPCCGAAANPTSTVRVGYGHGVQTVFFNVPHCDSCAVHVAARQPGSSTCAARGHSIVVRPQALGKGLSVAILRDEYARAFAAANEAAVDKIEPGVDDRLFAIEGVGNRPVKPVTAKGVIGALVLGLVAALAIVLLIILLGTSGLVK